MLEIKNLTLLSKKKKEKKGGNFDHGCKKIELCPFFSQHSVAFWLDFNQNLVLYQMKVISGRWLYC